MDTGQQYNQDVNALSDKIAALIKAERPDDYQGGLAAEAVLLAQHKLFGAAYMWRLFTGNLC